MRKHGFTFMEIMLVIAIVAFLAALVVVNYHSYYLKQLTLTTAQSIRSDLDFSIQHAVTRGIIPKHGIRYRASSSFFQVADQEGIVRSTQIPAVVQVAVSGFEKGNPAKGATVDIVPSGFWIGFLPRGTPATDAPALIVVATNAVWYVIAINDAGEVSGPTNNRSQISLSDSELTSLLSAAPVGGPNGVMIQVPGAVATGQDTLSSGMVNTIKQAWKL